jgi:HAD superfamily hydrolase (TIGR01509 family)
MLRFDGIAIGAVAFDMDGLMFDSERVACELWCSACKNNGWDVPQETMRGLIGLSAQRGRQHLMGILGPEFPYDAVRADRLRFEAAFYRDNEVPLKLGLKELLAWLKDRGIPAAVATSTTRPRVLPLLEKARVAEFFQFALCGDEVTHTKPHPEMYLTASARLGVAPENCLVLEDSHAGIEAAYAAGTVPFLIPDLLEPDEITLRRAVRRFSSLLEVRDYLDQAALKV